MHCMRCSVERGTHPVAAEEAPASFCSNLAAANSRITRKNATSPDRLRWEAELFSTDCLVEAQPMRSI